MLKNSEKVKGLETEEKVQKPKRDPEFRSYLMKTFDAYQAASKEIFESLRKGNSRKVLSLISKIATMRKSLYKKSKEFLKLFDAVTVSPQTSFRLSSLRTSLKFELLDLSRLPDLSSEGDISKWVGNFQATLASLIAVEGRDLSASTSSLRGRVIRLAYHRPDLRGPLMSVLK